MQILIKHWLLLTITGLATPLFSSTVYAQADAKQQHENDIPDREMLEFLADYGDTDDETFDLIIFHGKQDSDKAVSANTSTKDQTPIAQELQNKELSYDH